MIYDILMKTIELEHFKIGKEELLPVTFSAFEIALASFSFTDSIFIFLVLNFVITYFFLKILYIFQKTQNFLKVDVLKLQKGQYDKDLNQ